MSSKTGVTQPTMPVPPKEPEQPTKPVPEIGGQTGPEPTRYGDWEKNGRCTDF
jgi:hypothetical protein